MSELSYQNGDISIYFEDCVEGMKRRVRTASVQAIITDPPYGIDYSGKTRFYSRRSDLVTAGYVDIPFDDYESWSERWLTEAFRVLKYDGSCYTFCCQEHIHHVVLAAERAGFKYKAQLIYVRPFPLWRNRGWVISHSNILLLIKSDSYKWNAQEKYQKNVLYAERIFTNPDEEEMTPTRLSKNVVYQLMKTSTDTLDLVLEPFTGSGTVPYCAFNIGRKCVAFEVNLNMKPAIESNFTSDALSLIGDDTL